MNGLLATWRTRTIADLTTEELADILAVLVVLGEITPGEAEAFGHAVRAGAAGLMPQAERYVLEYLRLDVPRSPADVQKLLARRASQGTSGCVGCV